MTTIEKIGRTHRDPDRLSVYTIEYTSSEHRGIIMHAEIHSAKSPIEALAYARSKFADVQTKYGARGYRVRDGGGSYHSSERTGG